MHDLAFPVHTLKQEHQERLQRIQREQLARQLAGRSQSADFLLNMVSNLLIAAGQRLQAYAGETARPYEPVGPGAAS